jgi:uncharacterized protein (DUF433 family)
MVSRDPEVLNGELVFSGTRVPEKTPVQYLAAGDTIGGFLDELPV